MMMTEEEWAPIRSGCFEFAQHVAEACLHESSSKADIARSQSLAALSKVRRTIEAFIEARALKAAPEGLQSGASVDNSRCKFSAGGARCVSHCGDPICIAKA